MTVKTQKKLIKNIRFEHEHYTYDDGVDPRELLPQKKGDDKPEWKKKLLHESWAEMVLEEQKHAAYYEEEKKQDKKKGETVMVDHDRNPRAKSPMIPVPKNLVATDELGAPTTEVKTVKKKKKFSFRKMVKANAKGLSKKV